MSSAIEVGKRELPAWASKLAGRPVKLRELKDGSVLLRLLMEIFPAAETAFENHIQEPHPPNRIAVNHNWLCITTALEQLGLPPFDRAGIAAGRSKATLSSLGESILLPALCALGAWRHTETSEGATN